MPRGNNRLVGYRVPRSNKFVIRIVFATVLMTLAILAILPFTQALSGDPLDKTLRSVNTWSPPPPEPPPPDPPPPPEEDEPEETPELDEPPPMLDISMLESMLNPGSGGVMAAGLDLASFSTEGSIQEAIVYSLRDLDRAPRLLRGTITWSPEIRRSGISGTPRVRIRINERGIVSVEDIQDSPSQQVTDTLRQQVPKLLYESPTKDGEPVTAEYDLPIDIDFSR